MIVLIIIAAIILLLTLLLNLPVRAYVRFYSGKPDISVKYMWLTVYPKSENKNKDSPSELSEEPDEDKSEKVKPPEKQADKKEMSEEKSEAEAQPEKESDENMDDEPSEDMSFADKISNKLDELTAKKDAVLLLWELCKGHIFRLLGKIRIDNILVDFAAADEDAYEAAMLYGKMGAAVYNALGAIGGYAKITIKKVNIDCLYNTPKDKCRYNGECIVKLRPASLLNALLGILLCYLAGYKKYSPALAVLIKK